MAPRADVDSYTQQRVFEELRRNWLEKPDSLAQRLNLSRTAVLGALGAYTQAGRAIYDLNKQVYRVRELSREPLPMERLRFANDREEKANSFLRDNAVEVTSATSAAARNSKFKIQNSKCFWSKGLSHKRAGALFPPRGTSDRAGVLVLEGTVQDKGKKLNPSLTIDPGVVKTRW